MKRLVWRGGEDLALEHSSGSVPTPQRDEVLLKIRAVGICGTDIHILKGALPLAKPPMVLGHEVSGEIAAIGANVDHVREGDRNLGKLSTARKRTQILEAAYFTSGTYRALIHYMLPT